jgi:hypothetical protein
MRGGTHTKVCRRQFGLKIVGLEIEGGKLLIRLFAGIFNLLAGQQLIIH